MPQYDLFVSYRREDADRVLPLVEALRERNLRVWLDQRQIGDFAAITDEIRSGLARSKALLAWYSADYPRSRPCQMELTAALIAAQQDGDPRRRVLIVNPEHDARHVVPEKLADEQHLPALDAKELAERIGGHIRRLQGTLGAILPCQLPVQYGRRLAGANRFVGRLTDLWLLNSALHAGDSTIISKSHGPGLAIVSGLGGAGKSLLAEEYALRFGAAYPGSIFWLRSLGHDDSRPALSAEAQDAVREEQCRAFAIGLGIAVRGLSAAEIDAALARKLGAASTPFLWVVDDLAGGLDAESVRRWLAPAPSGRTLITTRSREYGAIGRHVPLDMLQPAEAYDLLATWRVPEGQLEQDAAQCLARDLGYHPLALEVAGAALRAEQGLRTFVQFRDGLSDFTADELELAADASIVGMLPSGHEPSVAATLLRSVRTLGPEAQDFLRLASSLAIAAIPAKVVMATFAEVDGLDERQARQRTRSALAQADRASLTTAAGDDARVVHALVSRTVRFRDPDSDRSQTLRRGVVTVLNGRLPGVIDIRKHADLLLEVLHARELVGRGLPDAESATLASWVARHDFERGAYSAAQVLQEQVLASRRRLLGDDHSHTLRCRSYDLI
jgi:TIR domain